MAAKLLSEIVAEVFQLSKVRKVKSEVEAGQILKKGTYS
jgi:hypothetical protein